MEEKKKRWFSSLSFFQQIPSLLALYCLPNHNYLIYPDRMTHEQLNQESLTEEENGGNKGQPILPFFNIKTIMASTSNFNSENELGKGGFGCVYKVCEIIKNPIVFFSFPHVSSMGSNHVQHTVEH